MTVSVADDGVILIEGLCPIEDAEVLLRRLSERPQAKVDWSACEQAHTAVVQVLMAAHPQMIGFPTAMTLNEHIASAISAP